MTSTTLLGNNTTATALAGICRRQLKTKVSDSRLSPPVRLLLVGIALLSWLIQPSAADSIPAIALLMFLRFVPVFVLIGSRFGRAGAGAVVGMAIFFVMMGAGALSFVTWDAAMVGSATHAARQAVNLGNLLYVLAALSLALCLAVIFHFNRNTSQPTGQHARYLLQIMLAVQLVVLVELAYLGYRNGWLDEFANSTAKTSAKPTAARQHAKAALARQ